MSSNGYITQIENRESRAKSQSQGIILSYWIAAAISWFLTLFLHSFVHIKNLIETISVTPMEKHQDDLNR
jgi:hypothetical protein